jgi:hypothetical protein
MKHQPKVIGKKFFVTFEEAERFYKANKGNMWDYWSFPQKINKEKD